MKRNGFTLVELLVVIAIIALMAMLLTPGVRGIISSGRLAICAHNQSEIRGALQLASTKPDLKGLVSDNPIPDPTQWPAVAYKSVPEIGIYVCPEDPEDAWASESDSVPGLIYKSAMMTQEEIPFANGTFCKSRQGEDGKGKYTEFVVEENTGHYSAHGHSCFGAEFWENRPWYPSGPDWSDNDGLFRFYEERNGVRRFELTSCTCSMNNQLLYYGELIWFPLRANIGRSMNLYINNVYTSYGINSAVNASGLEPDTILTLDYPEKMAQYSNSLIDKTAIADNLDAVSQRHRGRINVLHVDGSVRTFGASELKPTISTGRWTP